MDPLSCLEVLPRAEKLEALKNSWVCTLTHFWEAKHVQNKLRMERIRYINVTSMGDNLVLLQPKEAGLIEKGQKDHSDW